jgi:putative serine protease PepD
MTAHGAALLGGAGGAFATGAVVGVLALAGAFGGDGDGGRPQPPGQTQARTAPTSAPAGADVVGTVYRRAGGGVVSIRAAGGSGTGFVIDRAGRIVTNAHVVGAARRVRVQFSEDAPSVGARVVGRDRSSDLALVRVDAGAVRDGLRPLRLANSDVVRVGDLAVAIGNPFGLSKTVTAGIVSALGRQIDAPDSFAIPGAIQTDAAINPGNSGGPLLDRDARVIGVNSQIETGGNGRGNVGIGFAVPANIVRRVTADLEAHGRVRRAYLGVGTAQPEGGGALVRSVVPRGPAAAAGLRDGDVILRIGDTPVSGSRDVAEAVFEARPGERVRVQYRRGGARRTAEVRLGERPSSPAGG